MDKYDAKNNKLSSFYFKTFMGFRFIYFLFFWRNSEEWNEEGVFLDKRSRQCMKRMCSKVRQGYREENPKQELNLIGFRF